MTEVTLMRIIEINYWQIAGINYNLNFIGERMYHSNLSKYWCVCLTVDKFVYISDHYKRFLKKFSPVGIEAVRQTIKLMKYHHKPHTPPLLFLYYQ